MLRCSRGRYLCDRLIISMSSCRIATWKLRRRRCWAWWTTCNTPRKGWPPTRLGNDRSSSGLPATTGRRADRAASCRRSADCWPAPKWVWCTSRAAGRWAGAARTAGNRRALSTPTNRRPEITRRTCKSAQWKRYHCTDSCVVHNNVITLHNIIICYIIYRPRVLAAVRCSLRLPPFAHNVTFSFNSLFFFFFFLFKYN